MLSEEESLTYLWPLIPRCARAPSGGLPDANIWAFQKGGQGLELQTQQLLPLHRPRHHRHHLPVTSTSSPQQHLKHSDKTGCVKHAQPRNSGGHGRPRAAVEGLPCSGGWEQGRRHIVECHKQGCSRTTWGSRASRECHFGEPGCLWGSDGRSLERPRAGADLSGEQSLQAHGA